MVLSACSTACDTAEMLPAITIIAYIISHGFEIK